MQQHTAVFIVPLIFASLCLPSPSAGQRDGAANRSHDGAPPSLAALVDAAITHAGNPVHRARRMQSRARRAAWLPRLRISVRHGRARDAHLRGGDEAHAASRSIDEDLALDISLTFRLGQLVYALPTATLLQYEVRARRAERTLTDRVVDLYYERLQLACTRPNPPINPDQRRLRIARIDAELALLIGGRSRSWPPSEEGVEVQLPAWCASPDASPQHIRTYE